MQPIAAETYGNLTLSGAASTKTAAGAMIVAGNFLISSGTFSASLFTPRFAGNFTNSGTFTPATSTVIFNGAAAADDHRRNDVQQPHDQ